MSYGYGMGSESGPVVSPEGPNGSYPVHHQVYNQAQDIPPPQGATSISHLLEQIMNITDQVKLGYLDYFESCFSGIGLVLSHLI
jgi:hypothetical protein